jgi:hypothetical protein
LFQYSEHEGVAVCWRQLAPPSGNGGIAKSRLIAVMAERPGLGGLTLDQIPRRDRPWRRRRGGDELEARSSGVA